MKKITALSITVLLLICFSTVSATAGAARRHTIEGILIGTGVAILGAAIIKGMANDSHHQYNENNFRHSRHYYAGYRHGYKNRQYRRYKSHRPRGYWEVERIWVGPVYEKKWNPGHYNRRGDWISGRHEKFLVQEGYFHEEKVWVWH